MFTKRFGLLVVGFCFLVSGQAQAFDWFGGRLSIGGGFGRAKPKLPYSWQDTYEAGNMWTVNGKYFLTDAFSIVASYASLEPHRRDERLDYFRFRPVVGSLRYNFFRKLPVTPYLTAGAGYSFNRQYTPDSPTIKWDGFTYQAGLGLEFFILEGASVGIEGLYHHFEAHGDIHPYRPISAVATMNLYFGEGPKTQRQKEELERQRAEAERAKAEAETAKAEAQAAQKAAAEAQSAQSAAMETTIATQAQLQQAQADIDKVKQLMANKEISPIAFKTGSAELDPSSNATLDRVAEIMRKYPNLKVRIEGHTDNVGNDSTNMRLSQRRADAVRQYLTTAGVKTAQVSSVGVGETQPVASNDTPEGRTQNRRVEFILAL